MAVKHNPSPSNPDLFNEFEAGEFLGRSVFWLRNRRVKDRKLVAEGKAPLGPNFFTERGSTRKLYRRDHLEAWLDTRLEPAWEEK